MTSVSRRASASQPCPVAAGNMISRQHQVQNEMSVHYHTIKHALSIRLDEKAQENVASVGKSQDLKPAQAVAPDVAIDLGRITVDYLLDSDVHAVGEDALLARLQTSRARGLTDAQVRALQSEHGRNQLTPPPSPNWLWLLFKQLISGFNSVLWLAALFAFLSYKPFGEPQPDPTQVGLGVVLVLVVLFNGAFNLYQEIKSTRIVASFGQMIPTAAHVLRNGCVQQLPAMELVIGDIVQITLGDKIPADVRLLHVSGLQVDNSALTGESEPVHCTDESTGPNYLESKNMAFFSSLVVQGSAIGVVVATGDRTMLGTVSSLTRNSSQMEITSLHREINRFVLIIVGFAAFFGALIWITWGAWLNVQTSPTYVGYLSKNGNIINCIGLVVAFIPEGLPGAITLILTIVASRMLKQHVLVKSLATLETFNSVSVIATDKTGTLTQNVMTVTQLLWGATRSLQVPLPLPASAPSTTGPTTANSTLNPVVAELLLGSALCNAADSQTVDDGNGPVTKVVGDAADTAMFQLQQQMQQPPVHSTRSQYPRLALVPFNSTIKCMLSAHSDPLNSEQVLIYMKGAPEWVIRRCTHFCTDDGESHMLTPEVQSSVLARQEEVAKGGYRVIALVQQAIPSKQLPSESDASQEFGGLPTGGYTWLGMLTLLDPPRPEVPAAVQQCREAHIRVCMVTGDHPATAAAIAYQCGIFSQAVTAQHGFEQVRLMEDEMSRPCMDILRDGKTIQRHPLGTLSRDRDTELQVMPVSLRSPTASSSPFHSSTTSLSPSWRKQHASERLMKRLTHYFQSTWAHVRAQFVSSAPITACAPTVPYGAVVSGSDLRLFDDWMWDWVISHQEIVFARTSPEQKLQIVTQFQRRGEVVSVTGDGTNDAPALRRADLGVAMRSGTEVAREAGELVLLDNNFASIVKSIETGRLLGDNIKKVCVYLLPAGSWSELMPVLANCWIGMPLALSAFQMIIICMLTDLCGALAIVNETAEDNILKRPPVVRNTDHLVNKRLLFHAYGLIGTIEVIAAFFNYLWWWNSHGIAPADVFWQFNDFGSGTDYTSDELLRLNQIGQSIYFVTLVIMQFFNLLSTRTRYASFFTHNPFYGKGRNLHLFVAMMCASVVAIIVTQPQWFNDTFKTQPVPVKFVCPALGFGTALFLIDEGRKYLLRNYPNSVVARLSW